MTTGHKNVRALGVEAYRTSVLLLVLNNTCPLRRAFFLLCCVILLAATTATVCRRRCKRRRRRIDSPALARTLLDSLFLLSQAAASEFSLLLGRRSDAAVHESRVANIERFDVVLPSRVRQTS